MNRGEAMYHMGMFLLKLGFIDQLHDRRSLQEIRSMGRMAEIYEMESPSVQWS